MPLLRPGGVMNPRQLGMNPEAAQFVKHFPDQGEPVAAICHGPSMLVEAAGVPGHTVTSWPSLKTDIETAGETRTEEEVRVSHGVVRSRKSDDLPAFHREMIALFSKSASGTAKPAQKVA